MYNVSALVLDDALFKCCFTALGNFAHGLAPTLLRHWHNSKHST